LSRDRNIPSLHRDGLKILPSVTSPVIRASLAAFDPDAPHFQHQPLPEGAIPYRIPEVVLSTQTPVEIGKPFVLKRGPERMVQSQHIQLEEDLQQLMAAKRALVDEEIATYKEAMLAEVTAQLQAVEADIQTLYTERDAMIAEAKTQGYQAGLEEGKQAVLQAEQTLIDTLRTEGDTYLRQISQLLETVSQSHETMLKAQTHFTTEIVKAVLCKLLGKAWLLFPHMVLQQCVTEVQAQLVKTCREGETLLLRLAPDVWQAVEQVTSQDVRETMIGQMRIEVSEELPLGSVYCQVLSLEGQNLQTYDIALESQLNMLMGIIHEGFEKGLMDTTPHV
jgi:hypothetical protein